MAGIVLSALVTVLAGHLLFRNRLLDINNEPFGVKLPLYYMGGSVIISLYMYLLFLIKVNYSFISISLPFIAYGLYLLLSRRDRSPSISTKAQRYLSGLVDEARKKENRLFIIILSVLSLTALVVFLENLFMPIYIGDAYIHWYFKAKAIFIARTIPMDILTDNTLYYSALDYPLLTSLNIAWISICLGRWSDSLTKIFFSLQYISAAFFMFQVLKSRAKFSSVDALIATFITFTIPHLIGDITTGYVDVSVGLFGFFACIMLWQHLSSGNNTPALPISAIFAGAAAWTKNDGIAIFLALFGTLLLFSLLRAMSDKKYLPTAIKDGCSFLAISLFIFLPFKMLIFSLGIENHMILSAGQLTSLLTGLWRVPIIIRFFIYEFFLDSYHWLYLWIFWVVLLFIERKKLLSSSAKYPFTFVCLCIILYFCVYMVTALGMTPATLVNNLELSLDRVILGFAPSASFVLFLAVLGKNKAKL